MGACSKYNKGTDPCMMCTRGNHKKCSKMNNCTCGCPVRKVVQQRLQQTITIKPGVFQNALY